MRQAAGVSGAQAEQGTQPGCAHERHRYRVLDVALGSAAYDGGDRGEALSSLVAIRRVVRDDPGRHHVGFVVVDIAGRGPARSCVEEQEAVGREARRLAPVPPGPYQGVSFLADDNDYFA